VRARPVQPATFSGFCAFFSYFDGMTLLESMTQMARQAREASRGLARLTAEQKNACLLAMADALEKSSPAIQEANATDMEAAAQMGLSTAMLDRLKLDDKRVIAMARGLREVAALPDPVGRVLDERVRPNGLRLQKISTPIGVVVIIYESRPNVTADAASLCFKSGNAVILRGGKEAMHSNKIIARVMVEAALECLPGFPSQAIQMVPTADREAVPALLSLTQFVDLCMPRGGEGLIRAVTECSKVPVIKHYKGVCHVFVDREADLAMAESIVMNAKCQRPAVCNAMETLLVDRSVAQEFLPRMVASLAKKKVELRLNVHVADGVGGAIDHIAHYGSAHSDAIVTRNEATARRFLAEVDSAAVYWNASTRFTDGGEFGMGAEIGISTDKVGARGPMGLEELTSYKWLGFGQGQIRG
jgi:glutamate-5-semialdehyde dehydrogenase